VFSVSDLCISGTAEGHTGVTGDELAALCSANNPDIVCLVEAWLCGDVLSNEICIPNYSIVRQDEVDMVVELLFTFTTARYHILLRGLANLELLVV